MKKWQCSVCGYIHTGDEPPETCPVCGADKSKFVEVIEEETQKTDKAAVQKESAETQKSEEKEPEVKVTVVDASSSGGKMNYTRLYEFVSKLILEHHLHPISVHIPNGVIPLSVFFAFMAVLFGFQSFELASFYNMIFVLLAMPMVLFSGYTEWQKHYNGARTSVFLIKMFCGIVVLLTSLILVIWWIANPGIASSSSPARWVFFMIHLIMLSAAGVAGYFGGKLVFKD